MKKTSFGLALAALFVAPLGAELKPVGTVLTSECGDTRQLGTSIREVCIASTTGARAGSTYLVIDGKRQNWYVHLEQERIRIGRPAGCTGYTGTGVVEDDAGYPIHTSLSAVYCAQRRSTLDLTLERGAETLKAKVEVEPVFHTQSVE